MPMEYRHEGQGCLFASTPINYHNRHNIRPLHYNRRRWYYNRGHHNIPPHHYRGRRHYNRGLDNNVNTHNNYNIGRGTK